MITDEQTELLSKMLARRIKEKEVADDFAKQLIKGTTENDEIIDSFDLWFQERFTTIFPDMTYCKCSNEFNRQYFSSAFVKPVEVELIKSVFGSSDSCKFYIYI